MSAVEIVSGQPVAVNVMAVLVGQALAWPSSVGFTFSQAAHR